MERVQGYDDIAYQLKVPGDLQQSPNSALLIGLIFKIWIMSKSGDSSYRNKFIEILTQRNYKFTSNLSQVFDYLAQIDLNTFSQQLEYFSNYSGLFEELKLSKKSIKIQFFFNSISKAFDIAIFKISRGFKEIFCTAASSTPLVVHILYEIGNYSVGIHSSEYNFANTPAPGLLRSYPFILTQEEGERYRKRKEEIVEILIKALDNSKEKIKKTSADKLRQYIQNRRISNNLDGKLRNLLENRKACEYHKFELFPCGVMHCFECASSNIRGNQAGQCRCGKRFSMIDFEGVTKSMERPPMSPNLPPKAPENPNLQTYFNNPPNPQVLPPQQAYHNNSPAYGGNFNNVPYNPGPPPEPVYQNPQYYQCWACTNTVDQNSIASCPVGHVLCLNCSTKSDGYCSYCNNIICNKCGIPILAQEAWNAEGMYFHGGCYNMTLQQFYMNPYQ